jgi:nickel-type superoxide dismutase maturation protease
VVEVTRVHLTHRTVVPVTVTLLVTTLVSGLAWVRPRRFVVSGASMLPTLRPGDRVLVARIGRAEPGDVVVVRDPRNPSRLLCKRVATAEDRHITVRGDNPDESTDSRVFGPVPTAWVKGRVIRRYWPWNEPSPLVGGRS